MTKKRFNEIKEAITKHDMELMRGLSSKEKLEYLDVELGRSTTVEEVVA